MRLNIPEMYVRRTGRAAVSLGLLAAVAVYLLRTGVGGAPVGLQLSYVLLAAVFLLVNALLAGWRLSVLSGLEGYPIGLRASLHANAAGAALSQVMINFLGQTAGRVVIMRRAGIPADATITIGVIERLVATVVLTGAALVAALFLFGKISFGQGAETDYLLKSGFALCMSTLAAGAFVYRDLLLDIARQLRLGKIGIGFLAIAGISLVVHGAMLGAYLSLAVAFTDHAVSFDLAAACLIVMFTASLPISFGGWGVRELSAAAVLPFAGLTVTQGVFVALLIGVGSLAVHIPIWLAVSDRQSKAELATREIKTQTLDVSPAAQTYSSWLGLLIPILTSIAIAFSLHLPTAGGELNVNFADPLAIVGGALSMAYWFERRHLPHWRVPALNTMTVLTTAILVLAAIIGFTEFGFSAWAFRNRLAGWLLLLGYAATGALVVIALGDVGRKILLKGYVVALTAIVALEILQLAYSLSGWTLFGDLRPRSLQGFSQNTNAFAFMLVAGFSVTVALIRAEASRAKLPAWVLVAASLGAAIVLTSSRAGWGALAIVCVTAMLIDRRMFMPVAKIVATGAVLVLLMASISSVRNLLVDSAASARLESTNILELQNSPGSNLVSDNERWKSIDGGFALWRENPGLGAGLGAHYEKTRQSGEPLVIHNTLVWLLAETGLVGVVVFFAAGLAIFRANLRRLRDPTDVGATTIILLSLAFAAMAMVHELLFQRVLWFVLGVCLACAPAPAPSDKAG